MENVRSLSLSRKQQFHAHIHTSTHTRIMYALSVFDVFELVCSTCFRFVWREESRRGRCVGLSLFLYLFGFVVVFVCKLIKCQQFVCVSEGCCLLGTDGQSESVIDCETRRLALQLHVRCSCCSCGCVSLFWCFQLILICYESLTKSPTLINLDMTDKSVTVAIDNNTKQTNLKCGSHSCALNRTHTPTHPRQTTQPPQSIRTTNRNHTNTQCCQQAILTISV